MMAESSHASVRELLPWFVNGTLSAEERLEVEGHLKNCDICRAELDWLGTVSSATADLAEEAPRTSQLLHRTLAAVDQWEESRAKAQSEIRGVELPLKSAWYVRWFDTFWNPRAPVARFAFAAQLALILGLGIYVIARNTNPGYTTLSGSDASKEGARLTISFAPATTVEQMRRILAPIGGRIVGGPSASGIFVIELGLNPHEDQKVQAVIDQLRANAAIQFVEQQP